MLSYKYTPYQTCLRILYSPTWEQLYNPVINPIKKAYYNNTYNNNSAMD